MKPCTKKPEPLTDRRGSGIPKGSKSLLVRDTVLIGALKGLGDGVDGHRGIAIHRDNLRSVINLNILSVNFQSFSQCRPHGRGAASASGHSGDFKRNRGGAGSIGGSLSGGNGIIRGAASDKSNRAGKKCEQKCFFHGSVVLSGWIRRMVRAPRTVGGDTSQPKRWSIVPLKPSRNSAKEL